MGDVSVFRRYVEADAAVRRARESHRVESRSGERRLRDARRALARFLADARNGDGPAVAVAADEQYVYLRRTQTQTTVSADVIVDALGAIGPDDVRTRQARLKAEEKPCAEAHAWWGCLIEQLRARRVRQTECLVAGATPGRRVVVDTPEARRLVQAWAHAAREREEQKRRVAADVHRHELVARSAALAVADALANGHSGEGQAVRPDGTTRRFRVERQPSARPVTPSVCSRFGSGLGEADLADIRRRAQEDLAACAATLLGTIRDSIQRHELRIVTVEE